MTGQYFNWIKNKSFIRKINVVHIKLYYLYLTCLWVFWGAHSLFYPCNIQWKVSLKLQNCHQTYLAIIGCYWPHTIKNAIVLIIGMILFLYLQNWEMLNNFLFSSFTKSLKYFFNKSWKQEKTESETQCLFPKRFGRRKKTNYKL